MTHPINHDAARDYATGLLDGMSPECRCADCNICRAYLALLARVEQVERERDELSAVLDDASVGAMVAASELDVACEARDKAEAEVARLREALGWAQTARLTIAPCVCDEMDHDNRVSVTLPDGRGHCSDNILAGIEAARALTTPTETEG